MLTTLRSRRHLRSTVLLAATFGVGLTGALVLPGGQAEASAPACPDGPSGDYAFKMSDLDKCVWVNNDHNRTPRMGAVIDYNIYCPGRIPTQGWATVGQKIAEGAKIKDTQGRTVSPIVDQHRAADFGVKYIGMPHVFHYSCMGKVATHIKVRVRSTHAGPPPEPQCSFVRQSGGTGVGQRMDREYKCVSPLFRNTQRGGWDSMVKQVSLKLVSGEVARSAVKAGGKLCVLPSTDIQCEPCRHSDKLIVRTKTVAAHQRCPKGSKEVKSTLGILRPGK